MAGTDGDRWNRDEVVARLLRASPTAGHYLAGSLRPAARLIAIPAGDHDVAVGASKIGGAPDLPARVVWPSWTDRSGAMRSHTFFAQVDLAEVGRVAPATLDLPTRGLLSFFCDFSFDGLAGITGLMPWERPGCRIVYTHPGEPLARRPPVVAPLPSGRLTPLGIWTWPEGPFDGIDLSDSEYDALDELHQTYDTALLPAGSRSGIHQLGGHGRFIQHPVEEEVVWALHARDHDGRFVDDWWESARHLVAEWRVILQVDSDRGLAQAWGDLGRLSWAARQEDVAAGRWEAAMFNFQCS